MACGVHSIALKKIILKKYCCRQVDEILAHLFQKEYLYSKMFDQFYPVDVRKK